MKRGFTLIELSIVLVIIGLIVGGVLVGQDLIKAATLRSVVGEFEKYQTATSTFKIKYNCLAGDCANAETFFGTASGGCPAGTRSSTQTCNGDGDGRIGDYAGSSSWDGTSFRSFEWFGYWQHLSNAGLVNGVYTGTATYPWGNYGAGQAITGINVPKSAFPGAGYTVAYERSFYNVGAMFGGSTTVDYGNMLTMGANGLYETSVPILQGTDAGYIDTKTDDGITSTGKIFSGNTTGLAYCDYYTSSSANPCGLTYKNFVK